MNLYIKDIFIKNIWQIKAEFFWDLNEDVNILVGRNGSGKTTILKAIKTIFEKSENLFSCENNNQINSTYLSLSNGLIYTTSYQPTKELSDNIDFDYLNNFDTINALDNLIGSLRESFIRYQKNLLQKIQRIYESGAMPTKEEFDDILEKKTLFIQQINTIFSGTNKSFLEDGFSFKIDNQNIEISPYDLSHGEKKMFVILLKVLLQENKSCVFIIDEPEIFLHIEWQRQLISYIRFLNENCQLIIATHSPSIYCHGWSHRKISIEEVVFK